MPGARQTRDAFAEQALMKLTPFVLLITAFLMSGCVQLTIAWADLSANGPDATPLVLVDGQSGAAISSIAAWEEDQKPNVKKQLQDHVYGTMPDAHELKVINARMIDEAGFSGKGKLSEYQLQADISFGAEPVTTREFYMNIVMPVSNPSAPIILIQTFCPRWDTMPHDGIYRPEGANSCSGGFASGLMKYVFGRYIATPPIEQILDRGYGIATIFPSEFVSDSGEQGLQDLKDLSAGLPAGAARWGAIAAWGWGFSLMVDALNADETITSTQFVSMGHSRYGKSALVAAAFDDRISGVISHQSGTGGASLNREKKGESIGDITESYPHWFAEEYATYADDQSDMPVDQHHLLALIAPRPVLLGNARRDVWSDPNGAFRAAQGADPVYELYGQTGLDQDRLDDWQPDADIAFWIRPGTHGVVKEDWPAFLAFMDAHFAPDANRLEN